MQYNLRDDLRRSVHHIHLNPLGKPQGEPRDLVGKYHKKWASEFSKSQKKKRSVFRCTYRFHVHEGVVVLWAGREAQHGLSQGRTAVEKVGQGDVDRFICSEKDNQTSEDSPGAASTSCSLWITNANWLPWHELMSSTPAMVQFLVTFGSRQ